MISTAHIEVALNFLRLIYPDNWQQKWQVFSSQKGKDLKWNIGALRWISQSQIDLETKQRFVESLLNTPLVEPTQRQSQHLEYEILKHSSEYSNFFFPGIEPKDLDVFRLFDWSEPDWDEIDNPAEFLEFLSYMKFVFSSDFFLEKYRSENPDQ